MLEFVGAAPFTAIPILATFIAVTIITPPLWVPRFIIVMGSFVAVMWIAYWLGLRPPGHRRNSDSALTILLFAHLTAAFVVAAIAYFAGLLWSRSRS